MIPNVMTAGIGAPENPNLWILTQWLQRPQICPLDSHSVYENYAYYYLSDLALSLSTVHSRVITKEL